MSEFTSGTVRDLRYLYENVVHGEQEVLCEAPGMDIFNTPAAQKSNADAVRPFFTKNPGTGMDVLKGAPGKTIDQAQKNKAAETIFKLPSGSLSRPSTGKPPTTPAGSRPSAPSTTAPGGAGAGSPPNARSMPARPVLSKQGGVEGTGTGANFKAGAWSSADKSRYSAQAAKAPSTSVANAEKARIRGTNQTDNPLMKDFKSSLPAPTSSQSPAVSKLGAGNQSLTTNASVPKPAAPAATPGVGQRAAAMTSPGSSQYKATTPSAAIAAAPSSSAATSGGNAVTAANAAAAAPKPIIPNPSGGYSTKEGDGKPRKDVLFSYQYEDAYDLVLEYLLDDGHAATIAEAEYIMTELDSEVINQIVETRLDPRGRPASGPMNVYANPKGKPDQAHLDAVKAYDEKQKKKTPEQRKKELDAYIARQRNK
jgi:hypothetical protein